MLTDPTQTEAFRKSEHWKSPLLDFQLRVEGGSLSGPAFRSNSFSGKERNRLLLAKADGTFEDRSLVSGADSKLDARSFAVLDYDGDGWLDIALANANAPRLQLFRNRISTYSPDGRSIRIRLEGSVKRGSNRDAIGATLRAGKRLFRKSAGEGLASQNGGQIWLSGTEIPDSVTVAWPSGQTSEHPIPSGANELSLTEP